MTDQDPYVTTEEANGGDSIAGLLAVCAAGVGGGYLAVAAASGGSVSYAALLWPLLPVAVLAGELLRRRRR